jgi:hypothetical protein
MHLGMSRHGVKCGSVGCPGLRNRPVGRGDKTIIKVQVTVARPKRLSRRDMTPTATVFCGRAIKGALTHKAVTIDELKIKHLLHATSQPCTVFLNTTRDGAIPIVALWLVSILVTSQIGTQCKTLSLYTRPLRTAFTTCATSNGYPGRH